MRDTLFNTKKKIDAAIVAFQTGVNTPFWKLMTQILEENIKVVTEQILDGKNADGESATKEEMDRLRDKLKVYEDVKNTPERQIKRFTSPEGTEDPNPDPYQTPEELKEERKRVSG
jgi:hypothetical protein